MRLTEKEHSGIHLISQSLMMYHTCYQIGTILIYGYVKDTCVLLAHVYVNVGTSAPAASFYKLNSDVQWSHLINLDSGVALFSKTRWLYPSCLLAWYLKVKGICSYISSNFFALVILRISTYFLGNLPIRCLSVYWKCEGFWDPWNKVSVHLCLWEESSSSSEFTEFCKP